MTGLTASCATLRDSLPRRRGRDRRGFDDDDDHGVDGVIVDNDLERLLEHFRGPVRGEVDRVGGRRGGDEDLGKRALGRLRQFRDGELAALARVGGEDKRATGVPDQRDATPRGQRRGEQDGRDVEEFLEPVDLDDACAFQQGGNGNFRGRRGGRVRAGSPGARRCPARLQRHDGLRRADPPGDAGELARVAQRLQVERDHRGPVVVLEKAQQVVRAHVQLVPDRDEGRQAQASRARLLAEQDPDRTGLRHQGQPPGQRIERGKGGSHPDPGVGVDDAEAVRADDPHPVPAGRAEHLRLDRGAGTACLAEARGNDGDGAHAHRGGLIDHGGDSWGGNGDHSQVDRLGYRQQRRERGHAADRPGGGIYRVDSPGEVAGEQRLDHLMPDVARVPSCSDDGDRARAKDRRDAGDLRHRLPLVTRRTVGRRRPQVDLDAHRRRAVVPGEVQARRGK